jgi:hypothetical protein
MLSLQPDFPNEFYRLLNPPVGSAQAIELNIGSEHFPFLVAEYARKHKLNVTAGTVYLKPKSDNGITTNDLQLKIREELVEKTAWQAFDGSTIQTAPLASLNG